MERKEGNSAKPSRFIEGSILLLLPFLPLPLTQIISTIPLYGFYFNNVFARLFCAQIKDTDSLPPGIFIIQILL